MNNYSDVVSRIVEDYMERLKARLHSVPTREQDEFLREIRSHLFESYQQETGDDDVTRILVVLRKLGEPAEVVSDRLSETMMRSGTKRKLPVHVVAGIIIALFGIPLGFGGAAVLAGILVALGGAVVAFYAAAGAVFLVSTTFLLLGLMRIYEPAAWDRLLFNGVIQMNGPLAAFLDQFTPSGQGALMIAFACVFAACGLGMLWAGKHLTRGVRFLSSLALDGFRILAARVRRSIRQGKGEMFPFNVASVDSRS